MDVGALYEQHWPEVYRFLRRRVADHQTAEDLTADVFMRVLQAADRFEDRGLPPGAWLSRIARNLLIDHYRERVETVELAGDAPAGRATADAGSGRHMDQLVIARALMRLPPTWRLALVEQHLIGAPLTETAKVLGVSVSRVKYLRSQARARLRTMLEAA